MTTQTRILALALAVAVFASFALATKPAAESRIQIAVLLDTSNSMDGLIEQAKTQLWKVVNEFAQARQGNVRPTLEVAVFEYGNNGLAAAEGYIRLVLPLTTDLDKVSEELFALRTNGGDEYCGTVIRDAAARLSWSSSGNDIKAIFIAGNEPFTQGHVNFKESCQAAIAKGIVVNTIFCGNHDEGITTSWKAGADLADGRYMSINQDAQPVAIAAPQDDEIARLGRQLNSTYIAYGATGSKGLERQAAQDQNAAASAPAVMAERSVAKAQAAYTNSGWDLVDAKKEGKVEINTLKQEELPAEMQKMNETERSNYVDAKAKERTDIQQKIQKLSEERKRYIADQMKKQTKTDNTLDAALIDAVRAQAKKKGYSF
jgi:hypothetical protein